MPARIRLAHTERCIGCMNCVFACSRELYGGISSPLKSAILVLYNTPSRKPIVSICPGCVDAPCIAACPHKALAEQTGGGPTLIDPGKCRSCETRDCMDACVLGVLFWDDERKTPIICTQCGECAKYCPHEVIVYREV
ncbi:MAG: 4Fe-4S dicluster domain-containing protein [Nitrososphaerota archaeon]|nr:[Fe-S]-binding protein [Candidatus Bathyarchaeota archaeon]MDW8061726.1 4Fe-4S dicluster domain-containing protein [Nitrososphaerota archaeon]